MDKMSKVNIKSGRMLIIYKSCHHNNTKKVVDEMARVRKMDKIELSKMKDLDLSVYEYIGFASGIYFQSMDKKLIDFASNFEFAEFHKKFIIYTCGLNYKNYSKNLEKILKNKQGKFVGTFSCRGYDSVGLLKFIGGIAKQHPDSKDLMKAKNFIKSI